KRAILEQQRGGASLGRPDQEIVEKDGRYELLRRRPLAAEGWNAQISLLTGMAAATIMLEGGIGILRTMPPPDAEAIDTFRLRARALGHPWAVDTSYGAYLRTLDPDDPRQLAIMHAAASLFRGAGYTAFDGTPPAETTQSAVAAPYAHTTAPLRRLVDRFVLVVCEALANGRQIPEWARISLPELPHLMAASDNLAGQLDHATISAVEAAALSTRIGEIFEATVVRERKGGGDIQLDELAVTARCDGTLVAGDVIQATLVTADIASGTVLFQVRG
ncbi:MAG: RNB domain-containing ribonuclease, partial [Terrimesophilobacter sp.]